MNLTRFVKSATAVVVCAAIVTLNVITVRAVRTSIRLRTHVQRVNSILSTGPNVRDVAFTIATTEVEQWAPDDAPPNGRHVLAILLDDRCAACDQSMTKLEALLSRLPSKTTRAVFISVGSPAAIAALSRIGRERGLTFQSRVVSDPDVFAFHTGLRQVPAVLAMAPDGRMLASVVGQLQSDGVETVVKAVRGESRQTVQLVPGSRFPGNPIQPVHGLLPSERCEPYDTGALRLVEDQGAWLIRVGPRTLQSFASHADAVEGLAVAKAHIARCTVGGLTYWKQEPLGDPNFKTASTDCLPVVPDTLQVQEHDGMWLLLNGPRLIRTFASEVDAYKAKQVIHGYKEHCFIGRDNNLASREQFIMEYWR